jgi:hypothetical protein
MLTGPSFVPLAALGESYWAYAALWRIRTMPASIAPAIRTSVDFQLEKLCLPTALGCHFPQAATSVRCRFWAAISQGKSA